MKKKKDLIIFDGDCGVCQWIIGIIKKLDFFSCFQITPLQNEKAYIDYALTPEQCIEELKLVKQSGKILGGADAVIAIGLKLPLLFPVALVFTLPGLNSLAHFLYRKVANNRYRISSQCGLDKKPR